MRFLHHNTQEKSLSCLQSEIAPPAFNHTDTSSRKEAGTASSAARKPAAQRRVEDLEGELKRKIKLLEEERKALRKETQKHQEHIDYGLDTVHQRISSLEKGETEVGFTAGTNIDFNQSLLTEIVQSKMKHVSSFTHPHGLFHDFPSPGEHTRRYYNILR